MKNKEKACDYLIEETRPETETSETDLEAKRFEEIENKIAERIEKKMEEKFSSFEKDMSSKEEVTDHIEETENNLNNESEENEHES